MDENNKKTENCMICSEELEYLSISLFRNSNASIVTGINSVLKLIADFTP